MSLTVQDGKLVVRSGALGTTQACCCGGCSGPCDEENPCPEGCACVYGECEPACLCDCFEVGVKGRWDNNENPYADPNNEFWSTGTANDCGYAQAAYGKLDYPEVLGGYTVTLNAGGVTVSQSGNKASTGGTYDWPDAALTYDEDGCPNGITLGEPVWTCPGSEEDCEEIRQFLDANPPEINLRSCCPPSGTVWYAYDLYSGCCFFPEDWDGVSPYDPATDPFPDRDCGDTEIGGQGATLIGGPFRDQSECIDFYAGLGAQANRPGCVEGGRTCEETPCGENPLP